MSSWTEGGFLVTTDRARFDVDVVTQFLIEQSYWVEQRTTEEETRAADNSRCYSVLHAATGRQVGGARVVTDDVSFAWIADLFVLPTERGHGLGKFLMRCITDDLADVQRLFLGTRDAHGLYAQFGFRPTERNERWMERLRD
jgi:GNAT superfamily N-acetyltransferase